MLTVRLRRLARGFSLIELMIVVAIIGILAAIAIPNFIRFQVKARQSEARANLSAIYAAEKSFLAEWQQYYADFREIGYAPEGLFRYEHGFSDAGVVSPSNYTGMIGPSTAAGVFNTNGCGTSGSATPFSDINGVEVPGGNCSIDRNPLGGPPAALANSSTDINPARFVASAHGNIDDDAATDIWQINHDKRIAGPCSASAVFPCPSNGGDLDN